MFWIPLYIATLFVACFIGSKYLSTPTIDAPKSFIAGFLPFSKKEQVVRPSSYPQILLENKYISKAVEFVKETIVPYVSEEVSPLAEEWIVAPSKQLLKDLKLYFDLYVLPKFLASYHYVKDLVSPYIEKQNAVISLYLEPIVPHLEPVFTKTKEYRSYVVSAAYSAKELLEQYYNVALDYALLAKERLINEYSPYSRHIDSFFAPVVDLYNEKASPIIEAHWDEITLVLLFVGVFTVVSVFRATFSKVTKATLKEIHDTQTGVSKMYKRNEDDDETLFGKDKYSVMTDESGGLNDGIAEQEARNRTQSQKQDQKVKAGSKQENISITKPYSIHNIQKSHPHKQQWQLEEDQQEINARKSLDLLKDELSFDNSTSSYGFNDTTPEMEYTEDKIVINNEFEFTDDILSEGLNSSIMPTIKTNRKYDKRDFTDISFSNPLYNISSEGSMNEDDFKSEAEKKIALAKKAEQILNSEIFAPSYSSVKSVHSSSTTSVKKFVPFLNPIFPIPSSAPTTKINQENVYTLPKPPSTSSLQCLSDLSMSQSLH